MGRSQRGNTLVGACLVGGHLEAKEGRDSLLW